MKTRVIHTKVWKDEYFAGLTVFEKLLFVYLLTNDRVNISGIYELTNREIMFDLAVPEDVLNEAKSKLENDSKFCFYQGWVAIVNCYKYQTYKGNKNEVCRQKELQLVPKHLKDRLSRIDYQYPICTVLDDEDSSCNQKTVLNNKKIESETSSRDMAERVRKELVNGGHIKPKSL